MNRRSRLILGLSIPLLFVPAAVHACATCGCTLNSSWETQGYVFGKGFHFNLRFDYFDQDQLRSGTGTVDFSSLKFPSDREIQLRTVNRNLTLDVGYSPGTEWQFDVQIPEYDRTHSTIAEGDTLPSYSRSQGVGDIRLQARYQGLLADHTLGLQIGLKLPTGRFHDTFLTGPQAGAEVDRGLQLGTGTTDVLVGLYKFGSLGPEKKWGYFAQGSVQVPLDSREGFRPGRVLNLSGGFRYSAGQRVVPQIQVNVTAQSREEGINADTANSGYSAAYLSPGVTVHLQKRAYLYAFVQTPIYQRVNGYEIMPRTLYTLGLDVRF
jgi:hypothetical protein